MVSVVVTTTEVTTAAAWAAVASVASNIKGEVAWAARADKEDSEDPEDLADSKEGSEAVWVEVLAATTEVEEWGAALEVNTAGVAWEEVRVAQEAGGRSKKRSPFDMIPKNATTAFFYAIFAHVLFTTEASDH